MVVFFVAISLGTPVVLFEYGVTAAVIAVSGLVIAVIIIGVVKGEPLRDRPDASLRAQPSPAQLLMNYKIGSCSLSVLLILLSIPLLLRRVPKNSVYGFRIPGSLNGSTAHWFYVNEVAGAAGIGAGVLCILFALVIADRLGMSQVGERRAVLLVTVALILAAMVPPFLVA